MSFFSPLPFSDIEQQISSSNRAFELSHHFGFLGGRSLLEVAIRDVFPGRITLVSSFGTESAVLLHMISEIDRHLPITFIDTRKLFGETLRYADQLTDTLGLTNLRHIQPDADRVAALDADGMLFSRDSDLCCEIRKVEPMEKALEGYDAWITGRKGFQANTRNGLPVIEDGNGRIKLNPLSRWLKKDLDAYFELHNLPRHPLEADGFLSIGCMPCTDRVNPGEDPRAGRWRGQQKTECGIHTRI